MSDDLGTSYEFVPSLRRGFRPIDEFSEGTPEASARPEVGVEITPEARQRSEEGGSWEEDEEDRRVDLHVYGPGDVQGLDDAQVVRVEPEPDSGNFPANYFPFVEFDRADLPWQYSPERADSDGRTRPWMTLITAEDTDEVSVSVSGNRPSPVLEFGDGADLGRQLPDLRESWAWAHAQIQGGPDGEASWSQWATEEFTSVSNLTTSRIISPRNLRPGVDYVACLVPTFAAGRLAGLGREPYPDAPASGGEDSEGETSGEDTSDGENGGGDGPTLELAWELDSLPQLPFKLPLYHYWRFTAGRNGTFESLVTDLEPVELGEGVGMKWVDVGDPGPNGLVSHEVDTDASGSPAPEDDPTQLPVGGALYSAGAKGVLAENGYQQRDALRDLLNKPETLPEDEDGDYPIVGPPLYGQWHAGQEGLPDPQYLDESDYDPEWFRDLNLELRNRIAASIGSQVVKDHQSQLMAAAWEIVGEIREANAAARFHQSATAVGTAVENGQFLGDPSPDVVAPTAQPWVIRAEFHRMVRLGELDPEDLTGEGTVFGPGGEVIDPDGRRTGPGDGYGPGSGLGFGDEFGGGGWFGPAGDVATPVEGGAVTAGDSVSTNYLNAGGTQQILRSPEEPVPDGGATGSEASAADATDATALTKYMQTFLSQPETSLQYQRLVRADGPIARRSGADGADYDRTLMRVRDRSLREVEAMAESAALAAETAASAEEEAAGEEPSDSTAESDEESDDANGEETSDADATTPGSLAAMDTMMALTGEYEATDQAATEPTTGLDPTGTLRHRESALETTVQAQSELDARIPAGAMAGGGATEPTEGTTADEPPALETRLLSGSLEDVELSETVQEPTVTADAAAIGQRLEAGSERRYRRGQFGDVVSYGDAAEFVQSDDPVTRVMYAPEFPTPMWRPLKDLDEQYLLPGAQEVPPDSVGLVVQNREFLESYMVGVNHEMARELLWRDYPTDRKGTYFRRFWNKGKGPAWELGAGVSTDGPESKDIDEVHTWDQADLGSNEPGTGDDDDTESVVLLVRGELFRRYPHAVVYAARARPVEGEDGSIGVEPVTPERPAEELQNGGFQDDPDLQFPSFRGRLDPDIMFLGFDLDLREVHASEEEIQTAVAEGDLSADGANLGWYFVFEERPGEKRFGLEIEGDDGETDEDALPRPVGVADGDGDIQLAPDGDVGVVPVGWDDIAWRHVVDPSEIESTPYVSVEDSIPGSEDWEITESTRQNEELNAQLEADDEATWGKNSAHMARITWRKPARVAYHAHECLPEDVQEIVESDD